MESVSNISKITTAKTKKIILALGLHAFALILFFILIDFLLGGFIFYKYVFLAEQAEPTVSENILEFDSKTYNAVLGNLPIKEQSADNLVSPDLPQ